MAGEICHQVMASCSPYAESLFWWNTIRAALDGLKEELMSIRTFLIVTRFFHHKFFHARLENG